ncbi:MAG: argininosuccinate lyase [Bacteroidota bacterium]
MKLWQKDFTNPKIVEQFTIGRDRELDLQLAKYDVLGSLAHTQMLTEIGLIEKAEWPQLQAALQAIYQQIKAGDFIIEEGVEDVHSQVELMLTRQLGDIGKKIHSGRSRNDQVLVDLRLFFRSELRQIVDECQALFQTLQRLSKQYRNWYMPGYTHTQVAMVSSFGLWYGAYAETLCDDLRLILSIYDINNQNPLGSAAGYGSSFPLDRQLTTELLGFRDLNYNVVHAQMGRGKTEHFLAFGLAALGATISKLANDICTFCSQNFAFFKLPDELSTGSSIMPHKKNPDVAELLRAKGNGLQNLPAEVSLLTSNLISGYHRDLQLSKDIIFPALKTTHDCLQMTDYLLQHLQPQPDLLDDPKYRYLTTVEVVNQLVLSGHPFREAYQIVGRSVEDGTFEPETEIAHTHLGSLGYPAQDEVDEKWRQIYQNFDFEKSVIAEKKLCGKST